MIKTGQPCSHVWHLCGEVGEQDVVVEAVMVAAGRERVLNFRVVLLGVVFGRKGRGFESSCLLSARGSGGERLLIRGRGVMVSWASLWSWPLVRTWWNGGMSVM